MKIDTVEDHQNGTFIIRIYDLDKEDIDALTCTFNRIAKNDDMERNAIWDSSNVIKLVGSVCSNKLTEKHISFDKNIIKISMSSADWIYAGSLVEQFRQVSTDRNRFQWLSEEIIDDNGRSYDLLIAESRDGRW